MFAEPLTIVVNAVSKSLQRVAFGNRAGEFESRADGLKFKVSHTSGKSRNHRTVRLDTTKTGADPFMTDVNRQYSMSVYLVIDSPTVGFNDTEVGQQAQALVDWIDIPANLAKVVAGES